MENRVMSVARQKPSRSRFSPSFRLLTFFVLTSFCGSNVAYASENGVPNPVKKKDDKIAQGFEPKQMKERVGRHEGMIQKKKDNESPKRHLHDKSDKRDDHEESDDKVREPEDHDTFESKLREEESKSKEHSIKHELKDKPIKSKGLSKPDDKDEDEHHSKDKDQTRSSFKDRHSHRSHEDREHREDAPDSGDREEVSRNDAARNAMPINTEEPSQNTESLDRFITNDSASKELEKELEGTKIDGAKLSYDVAQPEPSSLTDADPIVEGTFNQNMASLSEAFNFVANSKYSTITDAIANSGVSVIWGSASDFQGESASAGSYFDKNRNAIIFNSKILGSESSESLATLIVHEGTHVLQNLEGRLGNESIVDLEMEAHINQALAWADFKNESTLTSSALEADLDELYQLISNGGEQALRQRLSADYANVTMNTNKMFYLAQPLPSEGGDQSAMPISMDTTDYSTQQAAAQAAVQEPVEQSITFPGPIAGPDPVQSTEPVQESSMPEPVVGADPGKISIPEPIIGPDVVISDVPVNDAKVSEEPVTVSEQMAVQKPTVEALPATSLTEQDWLEFNEWDSSMAHTKDCQQVGSYSGCVSGTTINNFAAFAEKRLGVGADEARKILADRLSASTTPIGKEPVLPGLEPEITPEPMPLPKPVPEPEITPEPMPLPKPVPEPEITPEPMPAEIPNSVSTVVANIQSAQDGLVAMTYQSPEQQTNIIVDVDAAISVTSLDVLTGQSGFTTARPGQAEYANLANQALTMLDYLSSVDPNTLREGSNIDQALITSTSARIQEAAATPVVNDPAADTAAQADAVAIPPDVMAAVQSKISQAEASQQAANNAISAAYVADQAVELAVASAKTAQDAATLASNLLPIYGYTYGGCNGEQVYQQIIGYEQDPILAAGAVTAKNNADVAAQAGQNARTAAYVAIHQANVDRDAAVAAANVAGVTLPDSLQGAPLRFPINYDIPGHAWYRDLDVIGVGPDVWSTNQGNGVIIAVIDADVDSNNPALYGNVLSGWDYVDGDADTSNGSGFHGTMVAGVIDTIAPGVSILPFRVYDHRVTPAPAAGLGFIGGIIGDIGGAIGGAIGGITDALTDAASAIFTEMNNLSGGRLGEVVLDVTDFMADRGIDAIAFLNQVIPGLINETVTEMFQGIQMIKNVYNAINSAVAQGTDIINLSLIVPDFNVYTSPIGAVLRSTINAVLQPLKDTLQSAVNNAVNHGVFVVAAAGNHGGNADNTWPASLDNVITVGATKPGNTIAAFSNTGNSLDIVAPGVGIATTSVMYGDALATGTSATAPMVSGALALLISQYPGESNASILNRLYGGTTDLGAPGWDPIFGNGLLSITNSLNLNPVMSTPALQIPPAVIVLPSALPAPPALQYFIQMNSGGCDGGTYYSPAAGNDIASGAQLYELQSFGTGDASGTQYVAVASPKSTASTPPLAGLDPGKISFPEPIIGPEPVIASVADPSGPASGFVPPGDTIGPGPVTQEITSSNLVDPKAEDIKAGLEPVAADGVKEVFIPEPVVGLDPGKISIPEPITEPVVEAVAEPVVEQTIKVLEHEQLPTLPVVEADLGMIFIPEPITEPEPVTQEIPVSDVVEPKAEDIKAGLEPVAADGVKEVFIPEPVVGADSGIISIPGPITGSDPVIADAKLLEPEVQPVTLPDPVIVEAVAEPVVGADPGLISIPEPITEPDPIISSVADPSRPASGFVPPGDTIGPGPVTQGVDSVTVLADVKEPAAAAGAQATPIFTGGCDGTYVTDSIAQQAATVQQTTASDATAQAAAAAAIAQAVWMEQQRELGRNPAQQNTAADAAAQAAAAAAVAAARAAADQAAVLAAQQAVAAQQATAIPPDVMAAVQNKISQAEASQQVANNAINAARNADQVVELAVASAKTAQDAATLASNLLPIYGYTYAGCNSDPAQYIIGYEQDPILAAGAVTAKNNADAAAQAGQNARTAAYVAIHQANVDRELAITAANSIGVALPASLQGNPNANFPVNGGNAPAMWYLDAIGVGPDVWSSTQGNGVIVAVIDTGIDVNHPAFYGNLLTGWDYVDGDADLNHVARHGTAVAGIIDTIAPGATILPMRVIDQATDDYFEAGFLPGLPSPFDIFVPPIPSNPLDLLTPSGGWRFLNEAVKGTAEQLNDLSGGLLGQAWDEIVAVTGQLTTELLIALNDIAPDLMPKALKMFVNGIRMAKSMDNAIRSAVDQGARVISISLGVPHISHFFDTFASSLKNKVQDAVNYATGKGAFVVAAAGNERNNTFDRPGFLWDGGVADGAWPAGLDNVITVGATQQGNAIASFSSFGNSLDIAAPGTDVYTTAFGGGYQNAGFGTSYSTPMVSAALALLISQYPGETNASILDRLKRGAVDLGAPGWDPDYGNGLLNITNSLHLNPVMSTPALQIPPTDVRIPTVRIPRTPTRGQAL